MHALTPEEEITIASYNRNATKWSEKHASSGFWSKEMTRFNELLPGGRILEIGAGSGRDAKELIRHGYEYIGTDISDELLKIARKNNPDTMFERVSIYELNYKELYDGFWCSAVLLHIPKDRINTGLTAIKRNMKTGAIGFISIKEGSGSRLEDDTYALDSKRFFEYWNDKSFSQLLEENGFKIIENGGFADKRDTKWLTYFVKT